ncbi:hypothetical protein DRQ26_07005, partial [bacterium]
NLLQKQIDRSLTQEKVVSNEIEDLNNSIASGNLSNRKQKAAEEELASKTEELNQLQSDSKEASKSLNKAKANQNIIAQINQLDSSEIAQISTSTINLSKLSQDIENKSDESIYSDAKLLEETSDAQAAVLADNAQEEQNPIARFEGKKYDNEAQKSAAQTYLKPIVDEISKTQESTQIATQKITKAAVASSVYKEEMNKLSAEHDSLTAELQITSNVQKANDIVAEILTNEKKSVALQRKTIAADILSNTYKEDRLKNSTSISSLTDIYNNVDKSIDNEDYSSSKSASSTTIEHTATPQISPIDKANQMVENLNIENASLDKVIGNGEKKLDKLVAKKSKAEVKADIASSNAYLTENENKKQKLEQKAKKYLAESENYKDEILAINETILPAKQQKIANENFAQTLVAVAQDIENQNIDTSIDTILMANILNNNEIAVDSSVYANNYIADNSILNTSSNDSTNEISKMIYTNSIDLVYFSGIDIYTVKKYLVDREIQLVNQNINVLRMKRSSVMDIDGKQEITEEIASLEDRHEILTNLSDDFDEEIGNLSSRGQETIFDKNNMTASQVANRIGNQAEEMRVVADSLSQLADNKKRRERKAMQLKAHVMNKKAYELEDEAAEIVAIDNNTKYMDNQVAIASMNPAIANDARMNQAKQMLENSQTNFNLAQENRDAAVNPDLTPEEKQSILDEAANLEILALNQQTEALAIYQKELGQDSVLLASRSPEEIPNDNQNIETIIADNQIDNNIQDNTSKEENPNANQNIETTIADNQIDNTQEENPITNPQNSDVSYNNTEVTTANPTLEMIRRATPIQLVSISETNLSPEVRREVRIKKSSVLGIYIDPNTNNQ